MKKTQIVFRYAFLYLIIFSANNIFAEDIIPKNPDDLIHWEINLREDLRKGEEVRLELKAIIQKKWHIYSIQAPEEDAPPPTKIQITSKHLTTLGPTYETRPIFNFDKVAGLKLLYHEGEVLFYQNFKIKKSTPETHSEKLVLSIIYQICSDRICLPPKNKIFEVKYSIEDKQARKEYLISDRSIDTLEPSLMQQNLWGEGLLPFVGFAILMGFLSILTPCVFPMIPITVSYFSYQSHQNKKHFIQLSLTFISGIILFFTVIGVLSSILFGANSIYLVSSHYLTNLFIGGLFIFFGFSLIGLFEIKLPHNVVNYVDQKSRNTRGFMGVLLMGVAFTLTAFTCNIQFVGTLLVAASKGERFWPIIGLLSYSVAFSFPFLILSFLPKLIGKMSRLSGKWLVNVKVVVGIIEILIAFKFIANADLVLKLNVLTRDLLIYFWILGIIIIFLKISSFTKNRKTLFYTFLNFGVCCLIILKLISGLNNVALGSVFDAVLPPSSTGILKSPTAVTQEELESLDWHENFKISLLKAKQENRKIFLDFTGYTCINCRWMEQNIFPEKSVHFLLKENFILARLYTDGGPFQKENLDLQIERFNTIALPLYVILNSDGSEILRYHGTSYRSEDFINFLKKGLSNNENNN